MYSGGGFGNSRSLGKRRSANRYKHVETGGSDDEGRHELLRRYSQSNDLSRSTSRSSLKK